MSGGLVSAETVLAQGEREEGPLGEVRQCFFIHSPTVYGTGHLEHTDTSDRVSTLGISRLGAEEHPIGT